MPKFFENKALLASVVSVAAGLWIYVVQRRKVKSKAEHAIPSALLASPFKKELQVAVGLALQAGSNMMPYYDAKGSSSEHHHDLGIETKGQAEDFCTKIDVENEKLVTDGIKKNFPTHKVIGEEATGTGEIPPLTNDPTYIIDPIDGTTNYAAGLPLSCVSIGFCFNRKPTVGVVYAPMTNELFLAVRGHGAFRNGVRISKRTDKTLMESVVGFEFGYARDAGAIRKMVSAVERILSKGCRTVFVQSCRTVRCLGSGVLDLCYVSSGRLDVVYAGVASEGWKPWDYCAGVVVAEEAGCAVEAIRNHKGEAFDIYSDSIICAAGPSLLKEVRQQVLSD